MVRQARGPAGRGRVRRHQRQRAVAGAAPARAPGAPAALPAVRSIAPLAHALTCKRAGGLCSVLRNYQDDLLQDIKVSTSASWSMFCSQAGQQPCCWSVTRPAARSCRLCPMGQCCTAACTPCSSGRAAAGWARPRHWRAARRSWGGRAWRRWRARWRWRRCARRCLACAWPIATRRAPARRRRSPTRSRRAACRHVG